MGSLNKSHHDTTGGVVIFSGELILLYCDAVHCEVDGKGSVSSMPGELCTIREGSIVAVGDDEARPDATSRD